MSHVKNEYTNKCLQFLLDSDKLINYGFMNWSVDTKYDYANSEKNMEVIYKTIKQMRENNQDISYDEFCKKFPDESTNDIIIELAHASKLENFPFIELDELHKTGIYGMWASTINRTNGLPMQEEQYANDLDNFCERTETSFYLITANGCDFNINDHLGKYKTECCEYLNGFEFTIDQEPEDFFDFQWIDIINYCPYLNLEPF